MDVDDNDDEGTEEDSTPRTTNAPAPHPAPEPEDGDLGQEIHILFIMVLLTITIFFCHSLIRLCMLILNPPPPPDPNNPAFSLSIANPSEGFQPVVPIRVHLRRDEEAAAADLENDLVDAADPEKDLVPPPPPAYGLWRSSVRVNPDLLHWQRVDGAAAGSMRGSAMSSNIGSGGSRNGSVTSRNGSVTGGAPRSSPLASSGGSTRGSAVAAPSGDVDEAEELDMGPRPPSYASEDGRGLVSVFFSVYLMSCSLSTSM
ncbi:conserved hypothetical protein [Pyrenophora tritici-repentis Pt-1C-BFP]|uniref:Uncharacterized protein n=1 Tax=Pyrenophora tritici-repentis (strain Pt-1C-BFP) TaxID=426418 RepID=B2W4B2_PYRTR|nr:uncharacterized protein PTRG_04462 [Pyrenophora tritici-repentis Pt-1C-BFP]EDU47369.1 conserved hypothetical protein [Pyrenophora tritici-repentis Pt-1C-BFP]